MGYNSNKRNALYVRYLLHLKEINSLNLFAWKILVEESSSKYAALAENVDGEALIIIKQQH